MRPRERFSSTIKNVTSGAVLTSYRIYKLNPNGHILAGSDADCASDEAAFARARTILGGNVAAEIWQGARLVGRLERAPDASLALSHTAQAGFAGPMRPEDETAPRR